MLRCLRVWMTTRHTTPQCARTYYLAGFCALQECASQVSAELCEHVHCFHATILRRPHDGCHALLIGCRHAAAPLCQHTDRHNAVFDRHIPLLTKHRDLKPDNVLLLHELSAVVAC